jgi:hypothetical protein
MGHVLLNIKKLNIMTKDQKIAQLESQLKQVLEAYNILEEYACEISVESIEDNETITYANSIITTALQIDKN